MRFAKFILRNMESILAEWEAFASTLLPAAEGMTPLALRDHAKQILEAVAFIVREIMHAHGGDVEVRCDGEETTFAVRLPRRNQEASP